MVIVSSCLLGNNCKYNGGNNLSEEIKKFATENNALPVCPESAGGLPCPRPPAEIIGDRVMNREGLDVTEEFLRGSERCLESVLAEARARCEDIEFAILKARSPSCGSERIYDGTFSGTTVPGDGTFARLLKERNIRVYDEDTFLREHKQL